MGFASGGPHPERSEGSGRPRFLALLGLRKILGSACIRKSPQCYLLGCSLILTSASPASSQLLSPTETRMVADVDAHRQQSIDLLVRVVNINSGTMNFAGVREVGAIFRAELDALGFATRWENGDAFGRAGHLIAERQGKGSEPKVLLIGHLDTVFEPDSPFQRFEWLNDSTARGPGAIDMKGGDVIIVAALKTLAAAGALDRLGVTVVMTGDEESAGEPLALARQALVHAAQGADAALGFEDADGSPVRIVVARRGAGSWALQVTGTPAHSSQIFREDIGPGAIFAMAHILDGFRERMGGEQYLTFNPGVVLGGTMVDFDAAQSRGTAFGKENVIAEHAVATGDLRTLSPEQWEKAKATMHAVVAEPLPHTEAVLTVDNGYPPMAPTEGNYRLLAMYDRVSQDLGFGPVTAVDPSRAGAADVSFVAGTVPMIVDGLGLKGHSDHTTDETADMRTLTMQIKRAAVLMNRIGR